jgi:hypothetical protein
VRGRRHRRQRIDLRDDGLHLKWGSGDGSDLTLARHGRRRFDLDAAWAAGFCATGSPEGEGRRNQQRWEEQVGGCVEDEMGSTIVNSPLHFPNRNKIAMNLKS